MISHCYAHADLVFIQNGMLQPWLDEKGLSDNTQVPYSFYLAQIASDAQLRG